MSPLVEVPTLKSVVSGSSSSLPTLDGRDCGVVCESVGKADLLSAHFMIESTPGTLYVYLLSTYHPPPILTIFALRAREVRRLLLELDYYLDLDFTPIPLGIIPHFLHRSADVLAPRVDVEFRRLLCLVCSF